MREHNFELDSVALTAKTLQVMTINDFFTEHDKFDAMLEQHAQLIVDTRGKFSIQSITSSRLNGHSTCTTLSKTVNQSGHSWLWSHCQQPIWLPVKHQNALELVGVCDTDSDALQSSSHSLWRQPIKNYKTCSKTQMPIWLSWPPHLVNTQQAVDCFEAGFNVLTEKPMATRLHDGERMVQAADKAGKRLFVVKQNRFECHAIA